MMLYFEFTYQLTFSLPFIICKKMNICSKICIFPLGSIKDLNSFSVLRANMKIRQIDIKERKKVRYSFAQKELACYQF